MELMGYIWFIEGLVFNFYFKYSFFIFNLVINVKIRIFDFFWKSGGFGNSGFKFFYGKNTSELSERWDLGF